MRTRADVWKLAANPGDKTLYWYAVAVQELQNRMFDNPLSWKFQAAVHGYDAGVYPPLRAGEKLPVTAIQQGYWDHCQHASWWFLPWHRIYVFLFESMCRDVIKAKGGPADWALPYWNASYPKTAKQRTLPVPFRAQNVSGAPNPLYAVRGAGVNTGGLVGSDQQTEDTSCLKSRAFSGVFPNGFGGGPSAVMQFSHYTGSCENEPHNSMHDAVGGPTGWMDNPDAAALDAIFWLHHANIDRLWVMWATNAAHLPPSDTGWLHQTFQFFDNTGATKTYTVKDVLQTTGPLCDYVYDDTTNPLGQPVVSPQPGGAAPKPGQPLERLAARVMQKSQMVGASTGPSVTLGSGATSVGFPLQRPVSIADVGREAIAGAGAEAEPPHVYLALENVTAEARPIHSYEVYVNVPAEEQPAKHPELLAGLISRFGLVKASQPDGTHVGQGLNLSFDITDIVAALRGKGAWDPGHLRVTFAPHDLEEAAMLAEEGRPVPERQPVKVGRVSVYTQ